MSVAYRVTKLGTTRYCGWERNVFLRVDQTLNLQGFRLKGRKFFGGHITI